ncbi:MAG TPA: lmo0937 family membrane protein [Candidatus Bathyarchaeia archaeon]|nr:lmo0937 family membrane protein [Candidatus Bathyarchaeia archaeon]
MDTFWTIVVILLVLWLVGFFALPGVGALIHILLVIALIVVVYRLLTGRNVVTGNK